MGRTKPWIYEVRSRLIHSSDLYHLISFCSLRQLGVWKAANFDEKNAALVNAIEGFSTRPIFEIYIPKQSSFKTALLSDVRVQRRQ